MDKVVEQYSKAISQQASRIPVVGMSDDTRLNRIMKCISVIDEMEQEISELREYLIKNMNPVEKKI